MGIKSIVLNEKLTNLVVDGNLSVLRTTAAEQLLPELILHLTQTIPDEIFDTNEDILELKARLAKAGKYLDSHFVKAKKYPFTMQRLCELSYHPLKYFHRHELQKFVAALEKCCFVFSFWEADDGTELDENDDTGEVALSKIGWLDTREEKRIAPFLREVESIISTNFGYGNDEGDEDGSRGNDRQEFYDYGEQDDDDDDDDQDYVDDDGDPEDEADGVEMDDESTTSEDEEESDTQDGLRKRKPQELDDYDYENSAETTGDATPKKLRIGAELEIQGTIAGSPGNRNRSELASVSLEQQISVLISPKGQKIKNTDNDEDRNTVHATTDE
ncbi:LAMI_0C04676g1_1 [Lachancea mirantina]|uniref:LAMI_0C04676g1_1 n=1 Tax=Lachancea mirantina TaxID=1230905 RepID=A0A1G4J312_9SACH|nr:LAMI_0C04676g1_1 [Lachancea mirantina]